MVATTNAIAKIAAVVAGLGLVAMSFASFAAPAKAATAADLQSQINALLAQIAAMQGGSSASVTFTMDQTIGSKGAEVTALQNWLISKGYSIPAGATGYFGAQTQAALAAYQAANGISPAAGYFGPITRAKVNAMAGGSTGSTGGTTTGGLSGGEADLKSFDLVAGDDLREGDTNKEIAIAKFDVTGGDVNVQRVTVEFTPTSGSYNEHPYNYVQSLSVYADGKKIGETDAGSKSDWSKENDDSDHAGAFDFYTIDIPVNGVLKEGDNQELSIRADAQDSIDGTDVSQTFKVDVDDNGIRAVDSKGIQNYIGDTADTVTVGFNSADNGDLTVKESSNDPDAGTLVADNTDTSDDFDVLAFEVKNSNDGDATITDITVNVATSSPTDLNGANITDIIRQATLTVDGDTIRGDINSDNTIDFNNIDVGVSGNDTTKFVLSVQLFGQTGHYVATGHTLTFSVIGSSGVTAEGANTGDNSTVSGTANGNQQSVVVNGGITVAGNDTNAVLTYNSTDTTKSYGTFTIKFDVTAVGDDVYVPKTAATSTTASTTNTGVLIDQNLSNTFAGTSTISMTSTADSDNASYYVVHDGDTETFTVVLTLDPSTTGTFSAGLDSVKFSATDTSLSTVQTLDVDQTQSDFHTDPLAIQN